MKILTTVFFTLCMIVSQAQVSEGNGRMSQGSKNGLSIALKGTQSKAVNAAWMKYLKEHKGKTKVNKKTGELFSDNAMIEGMSGNTVDIYSKAVQKGDDVMLTVWFDLGGAYLSAATHPDAYAVGSDILTTFSQTVSTAAIEEEIKLEEATMVKMQDEMKALLKEKVGLEEEITKCEAKITEAKSKIETNQAAQEEKQKVIDTQMEKVKTIKGKLKSVD